MQTRPGSTSAALIVLVLVASLSAGAPAAADTYHAAPLTELKIVEGELPTDLGRIQFTGATWGWQLDPYAVLDVPGEAYIAQLPPQVQQGQQPAPVAAPQPNPPSLYVRIADAGAEAGKKQSTGWLYLSEPRDQKVRRLKFSVPAGAASGEDAERAFHRARYFHYQRLMNQNVPGGAWFRHQARQSSQKIGMKGQDATFAMGRRAASPDRTYDLFTGGRAVSENLQLDRALPPGAGPNSDASAPVPVDSIQGISIAEMDWKAKLADAKPQLDPLAKLIPADQPAMFFPSVAALVRVAEEADRRGTPVLRALEPRSEDAKVRGRYERQLGLKLDELAAMGSGAITSVAVTGSDPYLRVGTDVALLFETKDADALRQQLLERIRAAFKADASVKEVPGDAEGVKYDGFESPGRSVSSFLAQLGNAVVVTNSQHQLDRLAMTHSGKSPSLAGLDEYAFFRTRYPVADQKGDAETAFLILTDATIRRWCGPKWRIADSRRTRAAAILSDLQAQRVKSIFDPAAGEGQVLKVDDRAVAGMAAPDLGDLRLGPQGVSSSVYGSLAFMTPIAELDIKTVTKAEADVYARWRDSYQRNWTQFFDPIAIRFTLNDDKLAADLTVMPLIASSDYNEFIDVARGVALKPDSGDPHGALVHAVLALNPKSKTIQGLSQMMLSMTPGLKVDVLGWLGEAVAVYVDDDPFWEEVAKAKQPDEFVEENLTRVPVALHAEVSSAVKLTAFIAAVRAFIEQSAPGMTAWETLKHGEQGYVRVGPSAQARQDGDRGNFHIYYLATADALVVTLNEELLKRAIDRQAARRKARAEDAKEDPEKKQGAAAGSWLGSSLALHAERKLFDLLRSGSMEQSQKLMQRLAWSNLPILNEWKRLYPDRDPVEIHQRLWHVRLVDPGGGKYVWNEEYRTMESTTYGRPGAAKSGPDPLAVIDDILSGDFGVTFEESGLRARAVLARKAAKASNAP